MMTISAMKGLTPKGNDFIDNFHDILAIITIFPIANIKAMIP